MGRDKAFIPIDGLEMVSLATRALIAAGATGVTVIGGDAFRLAALGLPNVADRYPGQGPLGGIISALEHFSQSDPLVDCVVILACDLIDPSPDAIGVVVAALDDATLDVAVPIADGRPQWLHAAWRVRALSSLSAEFDRGVRAPRRAVGNLTVRELRTENEGPFRDADRPEDLPGPVDT